MRASTPTAPERGPDPASTSDDWLSALTALLAVLLTDVLAGRRAAEQLDRFVTPAVSLRVRHWARIAAGRRRSHRSAIGTAPQVRNVHAQRSAIDAFESAVVIEHAGRVRAIAVRLDHHDGAWVATDLAPPEAGLPAIRTSMLRHAPPPRDAFDETAGPDDD